MRPALVVMVCIASLPSAHAQTPDSPARILYADGSRLYDAGQFLQAASKFEQAYDLDRDPAYQFNIGQAYRSAGECKKASRAYQTFIELAPTAPNIAAARTHLQAATACALFDDGRILMGRGQPAEACTKFAAALDEDPSAVGTLMNLGLCHEQLGKLATARGWFRDAEQRARSRGAAETERVARQRLDALEARVPMLAIVGSPIATVIVDGRPVTSLDRIELDPGKHVVEIGPVRREVTLAVGARETLTIEGAAGDRHSSRARWLGITGGTLVVGSAVVGLVGRNRYIATTDRDTKNQWRAIVRYGGTSLFVAGTAAIAGAVVIHLRRDRDPERPVVSPIAAVDHVGLAISGSF